MADIDLAVRRSGKVYRLITQGDTAGLFARGGLVERLRVSIPATAPTRMPSLEQIDGTPVSLARAAKPCSCTGAPWTASARDLRAQLQ